MIQLFGSNTNRHTVQTEVKIYLHKKVEYFIMDLKVFQVFQPQINKT